MHANRRDTESNVCSPNSGVPVESYSIPEVGPNWARMRSNQRQRRTARFPTCKLPRDRYTSLNLAPKMRFWLAFVDQADPKIRESSSERKCGNREGGVAVRALRLPRFCSQRTFGHRSSIEPPNTDREPTMPIIQAQVWKSSTFAIERKEGKAPGAVVFRLSGPFTARDMFSTLSPVALRATCSNLNRMRR
jgi:hypothetical protein